MTLSRAAHALSICATLLLASCGINQPAPIKQTYLLQAAPVTAPIVSAPKPISVKVGAINVGAPFRGRSLVFRETDLRYQSDFYDEYFVAPSAMLSEATANWLMSTGLFRQVVPIGSGAPVDYLLEGFANEIYADVRDRAKPAAVLEIKFFLTDLGSGAVVWTRSFGKRVPMPNANADAFAGAINQALAQALADLGQELAGAQLTAH